MSAMGETLRFWLVRGQSGVELLSCCKAVGFKPALGKREHTCRRKEESILHSPREQAL